MNILERERKEWRNEEDISHLKLYLCPSHFQVRHRKFLLSRLEVQLGLSQTEFNCALMGIT